MVVLVAIAMVTGFLSLIIETPSLHPPTHNKSGHFNTIHSPHPHNITVYCIHNTTVFMVYCRRLAQVWKFSLNLIKVLLVR